jgi:indole-3-glycerol phosphate synthase
MTDILREIIAHKEIETAQLDAAALRCAALDTPAPRDFVSAIVRSSGRLPPRLIAELKLASPSKGQLAPDLDVMQVAQTYLANGAAAISVLTDSRYFLGRLKTLRELRFTYRSPLPLLRKDFIIKEAQLYQSRANGADAVLLIVAAMDDTRLSTLHSLAIELALTPLVEVHNQQEIDRALKLDGLRLIGINNRDLTTFHTSLETTERLRPMIPAGIPIISESGISTAADVQRLARAKVDAVLVGEALVTAPDIAARVRELSGHEREEQ